MIEPQVKRSGKFLAKIGKIGSVLNSILMVLKIVPILRGQTPDIL